MKRALCLAVAAVTLLLAGCELLTMPEVPDSSKTAKSMFTKYGTGDLKETDLLTGGVRAGVKISGSVTIGSTAMITTDPFTLGGTTALTYVVNVPGPLTTNNGVDLTVTTSASSTTPTGTPAILVRLADKVYVYKWDGSAYSVVATGSGAVQAKDITITLTPSGSSTTIAVSGAGVTFSTATSAVNPTAFSAGAYLAVSHNNDNSDVLLKSINGNALPLELE